MYIIKGGTVHIGDGHVESECDVLIKDGLIQTVGKNLDSGDAVEIDARGCHVFPGFIDPVSAIGAMGFPTAYPDINEKSDPITPQMNIRYAIDPDELNNQEFYKSGITAVALAPGNTNILGGQMAVVKTSPLKMEKRLIREKAGLKCAVTADVVKTYGERKSMPMTRMGIFHLLDRAIREAEATKPEDRSEGQKVIVKAMEGEIPVFCSAEEKGEIDCVLHMFKDTRVNLNLLDGFAFGGCVDEMVKQKTGLILGNISCLSQVTKHSMDLSLLKKLVDNGNLVALTNSCSGSSEGRECMLWSAIDVYRAGIDPEAVISMMTQNPAKMLGVDHRLGTIEPGKDGDISVFSGHPVTTYAAKVVHSIISGEVIF